MRQFERADWAWRRRIRRHPTSHRIYRTVVGLLGAAIIVAGLALVPLPGPGWLIVFLGVGVLASEFAWAHRLHTWGTAKARSWETWVRHRSVAVRAAISAATAVLLLALAWCLLKWAGLPAWTPPSVAAPLRQYFAL